MKMIIDIPDEKIVIDVYEEIINNGYSRENKLVKLANYIFNGTPLTESDDCVSKEQFDKCLYELRMNNAYDMPSFWCHDNKDYKVIPTKYNKGYERAIMDIEEKIAKLPSVQPNREKHDEEIIKETVASIWGKPPYTEVLDKIKAEIEQAADKQFQIAMGVSDLNERYAHVQMENAYRHCLNVIDKYKAESEEE